jgi:hypothetical protein
MNTRGSHHQLNGLFQMLNLGRLIQMGRRRLEDAFAMTDRGVAQSAGMQGRLVYFADPLHAEAAACIRALQFGGNAGMDE